MLVLEWIVMIFVMGVIFTFGFRFGQAEEAPKIEAARNGALGLARDYASLPAGTYEVTDVVVATTEMNRVIVMHIDPTETLRKIEDYFVRNIPPEHLREGAQFRKTE